MATFPPRYISTGVFSIPQTTKFDYDVFDFLKRLLVAGVGEIVINSIDRDGEMTGYDVGLANKFKESLSVPLTLLGGAGSIEDMKELVSNCGVVGFAAGSLFVFKGKYRAVLINYPDISQKK